MTLSAVLERLVLSSPKITELAAFYRSAFGYNIDPVGDEHHCESDQRSIWLRPGPANQLQEVHWRFAKPADFDRFVDGLAQRQVTFKQQKDAADSCVWTTDPEGRRLRFRCGDVVRQKAPQALPPARLQHFAVRSPAPKALASYYIEQLGFTPSDWVHDAQGDVGAVFLRTDAEHHAMAIFRAPQSRFDHFSCETDDWLQLRDWADQMAAVRLPLAWGVGRHGPGNDTFFMVLDPDGNLVEISSDLEVCAEDRPIGQWPHEARTLNLWGVAIMRS